MSSRGKQGSPPEVEQQGGDCGVHSVVQGGVVVHQVALQSQQAVGNDGVQLHAAAPARHRQHRLLQGCRQVGHVQGAQQGRQLTVRRPAVATS